MRKALAVVAFGVVASCATYLVDMGCSCGPARGFPFSFVHPYAGCFAGKFVIRSKTEDLFDPVFDYASMAGDIAVWSGFGFAAVWLFSNKKKNENRA